jgi:hypothetical protein
LITQSKQFAGERKDTKMDNLLLLIERQLQKMTEKEKDKWILAQAKTASESMQESIYISLCGRKKILYMPEKKEIDAFYKGVKDGEIYMEYEVHYEDFDDDGNYIGEWEQTFHDPSNAIEFITTLLQGCHDLIFLEEYKLVLEILDELLSMEIAVIDHEDTEDTYADDDMSLYLASREDLISENWDVVLDEYMEACRKTIMDHKAAARKIVSALESKVFWECCSIARLSFTESDPLLTHIRSIIDSDLETKEKEYAEDVKNDINDEYEQYLEEEMIEHIKSLKTIFQ